MGGFVVRGKAYHLNKPSMNRNRPFVDFSNLLVFDPNSVRALVIQTIGLKVWQLVLSGCDLKWRSPGITLPLQACFWNMERVQSFGL